MSDEKKPSKTNKHTARASYKESHKPVPRPDGGACLARHESGYVKRSCSHRYQAAHRAETTDKYLYEEEFGVSRTGRVSRSRIESYIDSGAATPWKNDHDAWDIVRKRVKRTRKIDGKSVTEYVEIELVKVVGTPFRTAFSPWPNNAHHLIPVATLHAAIAECSSGDEGVLDRIIEALLHKDGPYNINHHENMMILPQQAKVSYRIGLPTHKGSHDKYSKEVEAKVRQIMDAYANHAENRCLNPVESKDIRDKLVELSKSLRNAVIDSRNAFRERYRDKVRFAANGEVIGGKAYSVKALGINSSFFCDLVAKIGV